MRRKTKNKSSYYQHPMKNTDSSHREPQSFPLFDELEELQPSQEWMDRLDARITGAGSRKPGKRPGIPVTLLLAFIMLLNVAYAVNCILAKAGHTPGDKDGYRVLSDELLIHPLPQD